MKIVLVLKDSIHKREYDCDYSFWNNNGLIYIRTKDNKLHAYPMIHIWRIEVDEVPKYSKLKTIKEY